MMRTLKWLGGERIIHGKPRAEKTPLAPVFSAPFLNRARAAANSTLPARSPHQERLLRRRKSFSASTPRTSEAPLIYAVDDLPELTELYATLLGSIGYVVKAFSDRAEALAALQAERTKPDLLITDCLGRPMPVDRFIRQCLAVHPTLRILMASGFDQTDARVAQARPDRFIQKPFTLDELQREVRAALTA